MNENLDPNWMGDSEEDEIYKENILDHFKNPRNFKSLKDYDIYHKEFNPICGDNIQLFVKLNSNKVIDAGFIGNGCAISMASASMLTEKLKGLSLEEMKNIKKEEILEMIGIPLGIVRMKCGLLSLKTLINGIKIMGEKNEQVSY